MNRLLTAVPMGILLGLLLGSCSTSGSGSATAGIPADLRIMLGEGGGFSGLWSGFTLTSGDSVFRWTGRLPGDNLVAVGSVPHDSLLALWRSIDASSLLDSVSTETQANLVHLVAIRAQGRERSFTWAESAPAGPPSAALLLNARIRSLLAQPLQK